MSKQSNTALIRADAGGVHGMGHVMRMIALAQAWQDRGGKTIMASVSCPSSTIQKIQDENIYFEQIAEKEGSKAEVRATIQLADKLNCRWIILDGYHFDEQYQKTVKDAGYHLICLDDYGHCSHWLADIVLNQNLHAPEQRSHYKQHSPNCTFLLGPKYALLRREFGQALDQDYSPLAENKDTQLLLTFGGVDPNNWTEKIIRALLQSSLNVSTTVVLGAGNPHVDKIRHLVGSGSDSIQIVQNVDNMATMYQTSDCIVSAAGSSAYEWLRYRLPALAFVIADNQKPLAPFLAKIPGIELFSRNIVDTHEVIMSLNRLIQRATSHISTPQIVDASGASRVVDVMLEA